MKNILIGVDAGGTKTAAAAYTADGTQLGRQIGAAGNVTTDPATACTAIVKTIDALLQEIDAPPSLPLLCVGAAGASAGGAALTRALHAAYPARFGQITVISDAELAMYAAHGNQDGLLIIAGTGSIGYRRAGDRLLRCGGWGHLLGDEGSGFAIALAAIAAITRAEDAGLPPPTALWDAISATLGIASLSELIGYIYTHTKAEIAALCPVVVQCAARGDTLAADILRKAGESLATMVATLLRRSACKSPLPLACSGSVLNGCTAVREAFEQAIKTAALPISRITNAPDATRGVLSLGAAYANKE